MFDPCFVMQYLYNVLHLAEEERERELASRL